MPENSKLLAWIEACDGDAFLAAFVGKPAANHRAQQYKCAPRRTKRGNG
jgi:hypothetical protein